MKPILPSLRERKRYVAFEIISKKPIRDFEAVSDAIEESASDLLGMVEGAKAGVIILPDKYRNQKGVLKVNHRYVNHIRTSLALIDQIKDQDVIIKTMGVSGILKKTDKFAM